MYPYEDRAYQCYQCSNGNFNCVCYIKLYCFSRSPIFLFATVQ